MVSKVLDFTPALFYIFFGLICAVVAVFSRKVVKKREQPRTATLKLFGFRNLSGIVVRGVVHSLAYWIYYFTCATGTNGTTVSHNIYFVSLISCFESRYGSLRVSPRLEIVRYILTHGFKRWRGIRSSRSPEGKFRLKTSNLAGCSFLTLL